MVEIKNFEMPHNCYDCDLHNYHECDITNESIEEDYCWNGDSREKHCPLREVEVISKLEDIYEELRQEYEDYSARGYYDTAYGLYGAMGIVKKHMESEDNK